MGGGQASIASSSRYSTGSIKYWRAKPSEFLYKQLDIFAEQSGIDNKYKVAYIVDG